jgi:thiamine-monophosphate kinase
MLIRLSENNIVPSSMIDVSDGLASDLLHTCKLSGTGCRIYYNKIPIDAETCKAAEEFKLDPVIPALNGGEDYELLFTVALENAEKIRSIPDLTLIGHMTQSDQGRYIISEEGTEIELKAQGWEKA